MGREYRENTRSRSVSRRRGTRNSFSSEARFKNRSLKYDSSVSFHRKKPRVSVWDVPPVGYEHLTPSQYKAMQASGQIASRIIPDAPPTGESAAIATATRQARRLYVGNIPFNTSEDDMIEFFNEQIQRLNGGVHDGKAVFTCQTNLEKNFAFLEFRSMTEATQAIGFDGLNYRGLNLKIRRPHDYHPVLTMDGTSSVKPFSETGVSPVVPDSPNKIYIGCLPVCLNDDQVMELLVPFGQLRGFNLVKDTVTGHNKGFGFCEYRDANITDQAIAGLNGMQLGDRKLVVQRANVAARNVSETLLPVPQVPGFISQLIPSQPTEILCLLNMVQPEDLIDDEEYEDIRKDIKIECAKYGNVNGLKMPRPKGETTPGGCGKVYVRFETAEECKKALNALSGRKFNGRIVMTSFYDPEKYKNREFQ